MSGMFTPRSNPIHVDAIDWALSQGYLLSVRDYSEDEYDVKLSADRAEILDIVQNIELPNVFIHQRMQNEETGKPSYRRVAVFSVIDEGFPAETINDYVCKAGSEFDNWWHEWQSAFDRRGHC